MKVDNSIVSINESYVFVCNNFYTEKNNWKYMNQGVHRGHLLETGLWLILSFLFLLVSVY